MFGQLSALGEEFAVVSGVAGSLRLADVLLSRVPVSWGEALALAQSLADLGLPDEPDADIAGTLTEITLEADGALAVLPGCTPAVSAAGLGSLLRHALPEPGKVKGPPAPGALRYTVLRALNEVEAPPIVGVAQLRDALSRFERVDRPDALRALHDRFAAVRTSTPPGMPAAPAREPAPDPFADLPLYTDADDDPLGSRPTVALERTAGPIGARPTPVAAPRSFGRRLAQLVAALAVIAAGGFVGYLAYAEWPRLEATAQAIAAAARSRWEQVRDEWSRTPAAGEERVRPAVERSSAPPVRDSQPGREPEPAAGTAGRAEAAGGDTKEVSEPAPVTSPPAGDTSPPSPPEAGVALVPESDEGVLDREGRVVQALDAGRRPIFSPSFAFDGSAVFFHEDTASGSGLREARGNPTGEMLHVVSLLDDGSRNYHPRLSPDGKLVAFDSDRDGVRGVYLSARDGTNVRRVSGPGYAAVPSWSPDGTRLAFIKAEPSSAGVWNIWVLAIAGGDMRRVTSHGFGQPWGASWFPDGRRICYSHEDRLIVLDTAGASSQLYPSPRKGRLVRTPAVSPDGRRVVFQLYRDGVWLLDLADGSMRRILADPTAEEFSWAPDGRRVAFHSRRDGQWGVWVMGED